MTPEAPCCHVLIVARSEPAFQGWLRAAHHDVTRTGPTEAIDVVRAARCLSIALVDGSCGAEGSAVVGALRVLEPHLPIVWVADDGSRGPKEVTAEILESVTRAAVIATIRQVLHASFYSAAAPQLVRAAEHALSAVFGCAVTSSETHYRACRRPVAQVCTALTFAGPGLRGTIVVGAERVVLSEMHRVTGSVVRPTVAQLHDVAGEIANHVAGRIKRALEAGGHVIENRPPLVLRSVDSSLRELTGRPALVARLDTPWGALSALLVVQADGPVTLGACPPDELPEGAVSFL